MRKKGKVKMPSNEELVKEIETLDEKINEILWKKKEEWKDEEDEQWLMWYGEQKRLYQKSKISEEAH